MIDGDILLPGPARRQQPGGRERDLHVEPLGTDRIIAPGVLDRPLHVVGQVGVLLDGNEGIELLDQPQAVGGVQDEGNLQHEFPFGEVLKAPESRSAASAIRSS